MITSVVTIPRLEATAGASRGARARRSDLPQAEKDPFEQGEVWHPGITALSQAAMQRLGEAADLASLVTYSGNFTFACFSNLFASSTL